MLKVLCQDPGERLVSLREVGIAVVVFLVEYVVVFEVGENLVEVKFALMLMIQLQVNCCCCYACSLFAFSDVVFDYDYIICVAVDVVVAGYVVLLVVVTADDAGVPTAAHVDA